MKKILSTIFIALLMSFVVGCNQEDVVENTDDQVEFGGVEVVVDKNYKPKKSSDNTPLTQLMEARTYETNVGAYTTELPYRIYVPENYDTKYKYPLVIFFHGYGERGSNNTSQLSTNFPFLPRILNEENLVNYPAIVLAPQCPANDVWATESYDTFNTTYDINKMKITNSMRATVNLIEELRKEFNIDGNRIYTTGVSMGGLAALDLTARFPELIAACAPVCPAAAPAKNFDKFENISLWAFHGLKDPTIRYTVTVAMVNAINQNGGKAIKTIYDDADHTTCWLKAFVEEDLLDFMFCSRKGAYNKYFE